MVDFGFVIVYMYRAKVFVFCALNGVLGGVPHTVGKKGVSPSGGAKEIVLTCAWVFVS